MNGTGNLRVFRLSVMIGLLPWIFWIFRAKNHADWSRIDWVMNQKWFWASSFKIDVTGHVNEIDVTGHVNVTKNDQKTRSSLVMGFLVIFCHIYMSCNINFEARGPKSFLAHNSVNSWPICMIFSSKIPENSWQWSCYDRELKNLWITCAIY